MMGLLLLTRSQLTYMYMYIIYNMYMYVSCLLVHGDSKPTCVVEKYWDK